MRRNALLGVCLALGLGIVACQDQRTEPTSPAEPQATTSTAFRLERGKLKLPAGRLTDQHFAEAARRAINPDDYVCPASTPVIDWYLDNFHEFRLGEPDIFQVLYNELLADLIPTYDALFFETNATPQYFGYNGEYTKVMLKTDRDTKRFWDISSGDIQLIGMHGTMLQNEARTAATYEFLFALPPAVAAEIAGIVKAELLRSEILDGGNHPLFSFNAFAFSDGPGPIPDKIVMGDGILEGYRVLGFGDVAPQAVYAHEFGHHIQFENDYFSDPLALPGNLPENTRYTELMADAFSAYYLTHKRGQGMKRERVTQFLEVFFQIGDCAFDNPGHHGTPNQRMAAAEFGFSVADEAQKNGHILTSDEFHDLFVAAYPGLVAPDVEPAVALR
jgi:hypothetical protein